MFKIIENYVITAIIISLAGGVAGLQVYLQSHGISNPYLNAFVLSALLALAAWMKNPPKK